MKNQNKYLYVIWGNRQNTNKTRILSINIINDGFGDLVEIKTKFSTHHTPFDWIGIGTSKAMAIYTYGNETLIRRVINGENINFKKRINNRIASNSLRFDILKRDNYKCCICGRGANDGVKLEIDHKLAYSKGGLTEIHNLWTLCFACNNGKQSKTL